MGRRAKKKNFATQLIGSLAALPPAQTMPREGREGSMRGCRKVWGPHESTLDLH